MDDLIQSGAFGGVGALFGAVLAWAGFRERMVSLETRNSQLEKDVVYKDTCAMCKTDSTHKDSSLSERLARLETTVDNGFKEVKDLIRSSK